MDIYKASSIRDLLSKENLEKEIDNLTNIDIYPINTSGLSGSKMYKIELYSNKNKKYLYLKVNNLQEDWLAKSSNDKGRELVIFKDNVYPKLEEYIDGIYIGYYLGSDTYAILMKDVSEYIGSKNHMNEYLDYIDTLAKFHSKFTEYDVNKYENLLNTESYYNFLSVDKFKYTEDMRKEVYEGWKELKLILGENLYEKYNNLNNIEELYPYFPKTFLHGDYRPDNILYIAKNNIKMIDFANSGCGPCTLDLLWYIITSVEADIDKTILIDFYRKRLEEYKGYKFTQNTWNTLLQVGLLCACRMFLAALIINTDFNNKEQMLDMDWWIENLKFILINKT